jgi:apolipoprotein N-acyltransferase
MKPTYPIRDRWSYLWLVIGTALGLLTYGAWLVPIVVWISPIFTLRFLRTQPVWRGFAVAWLFSFPMLVVLLRSVVPMPGAGYFIFVGIAALMALLPYLADRLLAPRLPGFAATLIFPLAGVVLEYANAMGEWGSWGAMAYTQAANGPLVQLVALTGMWGLVFLMLWPAALANWVWERGIRPRQVRLGLSTYVILLALAFGFGYVRLATATAAPTVRVAGIPSDALSVADLGEVGLDAVLSGSATPEQYAALREQFAQSNDRLLERTAMEARAGAKIVFWAEGNAPVLTSDAADLIARGQALAQREQIYLGMAMAVFTPGAAQPLENQVVMVQPDGTTGFTYLKAFPVPGAEALASVRGPAELPTLDTPYGRIAAVICFDLDHHHYIRQAAAQGVDLLFAPANTWPAIAEIHAQMATYRAVENGVTLVRPASNGISIAADAYGRSLARSDYWQTGGGALVAHVATQRVPTLYGLIGDGVALGALAGLIGLAGWGVLINVKGRRQRAKWRVQEA